MGYSRISFAETRVDCADAGDAIVFWQRSWLTFAWSGTQMRCTEVACAIGVLCLTLRFKPRRWRGPKHGRYEGVRGSCPTPCGHPLIQWKPAIVSFGVGLDGAWSKAELVREEVQRIGLVEGVHDGGL